MHVRVLGHAELCGGDVPTLTAAKPRALLTYLGLRHGEAVGIAALVDVLWGEEPPRTAERSVQTHVSTLRRSLGADAVIRRGDGWQLEVATIDVDDFTSAIRHGKEAQRAGDPETAAGHYEAAIELWRGAPVLPDTPRGRAEVTRWQEIHDALIESRADARLATGAAADLIADLEAAVAEAPLRERRWAQLMLGLHRAGRQADALRAYQRLREVLAEELGLEPSAEVNRLERRIALHDETLKLPADEAAAAASGASSTEARAGAGTKTGKPRPPVSDLSRRFAAAVTEPGAIIAAGGGGALGIIVGGGPAAALALAGVGWVVAVTVGTLRHRRAPTDGGSDLGDLREPWRQFVVLAHEAQGRFRTTITTVPTGPLRDRLQRIGERVNRGVQEAREVARQGQTLDDVRRRIDTFGIERQLDELEDSPSMSEASRVRTADALRSQLASADRLDRLLTEAHDRLRLLAAHLGEAVVRSFELSVRSEPAADLGEVGEDLDDVLEEMEVLREALDDTDLPGAAAS